MAWLKANMVDAVDRAGVEVKYIDRRISKLWDKHRSADDPRTFTGFYWQKTARGRVVQSDSSGPFHSRSAAIQDAFKVLGLGVRRVVLRFPLRKAG